ncbi:hypothetical protein BpHYR1_023010 [Brachionus plicatilis]|uniref:Uncharacterized protein n=1 Tax=Brachionus plicatilis TaxID=10195 RepID=A0A3M7QEP8_BRAPC|nr:hypothetical protein BpHYR1_023010 [Brachionus plicatilis]
MLVVCKYLSSSSSEQMRAINRSIKTITEKRIFFLEGISWIAILQGYISHVPIVSDTLISQYSNIRLIYA